MQGFQRKKQMHQIVYSPVVLVLLVIVVAFLGRATYRIFDKQQESARNLAQAQHELTELENKQENLGEDIERLSTPEGVEEELRSKYAIKMPGEDLVVIVDDEPTTTPSVIQEKTFWEKVKEFFGR